MIGVALLPVLSSVQPSRYKRRPTNHKIIKTDNAKLSRKNIKAKRKLCNAIGNFLSECWKSRAGRHHLLLPRVKTLRMTNYDSVYVSQAVIHATKSTRECTQFRGLRLSFFHVGVEALSFNDVTNAWCFRLIDSLISQVNSFLKGLRVQ